MIRHALRHLPGIGPRRRRLLEECGIDAWDAILREHRDVLRMGVEAWRRVQFEAERCEAALQAEDIGYLRNVLHPADHWRLLAQWFDRLTFFDIETTGCDWDSETTVIAFYSGGRVQRCVRHENLEDALDVMQDATLLVSFNGNTFDVPRILDTFHIPHLPAPHVDLRWVCYHHNVTGGLKRVEHILGMHRPPDLDGVDGLEAVRLWHRWTAMRDERARRRLLRYAAADVVGLHQVTAALLRKTGCGVTCPAFEDLWGDLELDKGGCGTEPETRDFPSASTSAPKGELPGADPRLQARLQRQRARMQNP